MDPSRAQALIVRTVVPLFREPDSETEQVSQALLGMPVSVLAHLDGWSRIRSPDGYEGWTAPESLAPAPAGWIAPWMEVEDLWINLRPRPDYRLAAAAHATIGTHLPRLAQEERWVALLHPDGRRLWTEAHRVREVGDASVRPASPRAACRTALRFLGVPYLWGGCSPAGIDCSGFVQLVLRLHGVELLRDAHQQAEQGWDSPTPECGDLVFFGPEHQPDRITHVGLMLDGRRFIHALGSDRVRIDRLDRDPFARRHRFARSYFRVEPAPSGHGAQSAG